MLFSIFSELFYKILYFILVKKFYFSIFSDLKILFLNVFSLLNYIKLEIEEKTKFIFLNMYIYIISCVNKNILWSKIYLYFKINFMCAWWVVGIGHSEDLYNRYFST